MKWDKYSEIYTSTLKIKFNLLNKNNPLDIFYLLIQYESFHIIHQFIDKLFHDSMEFIPLSIRLWDTPRNLTLSQSPTSHINLNSRLWVLSLFRHNMFTEHQTLITELQWLTRSESLQLIYFIFSKYKIQFSGHVVLCVDLYSVKSLIIHLLLWPMFT